MKLPLGSLIIVLALAAICLAACKESNPEDEVSPLLDKYLIFWNTGEFEGIEEVVHPDFELRMSPDFNPEKGIEALKDEIIRTRKAYPDFHVDGKEVVYDDNKIAVLWNITATHTGSGMIPATGKKINVMGMSIIHFADGKIRDEWIASNNLLWMTQLGFILKPTESVLPEE